jgi:hypothetical protein
MRQTVNNIKQQPTQTQKDRKRYAQDHFDIYEYKDFISKDSRYKFKHICDKCSKKKFCQKGKASIVLKCPDFVLYLSRSGQKQSEKK